MPSPRWLRTHHVIVTRIATRSVADHLDAAESPTGDSAYVCLAPMPVPGREADSPLLASPNQWGQTPFPLSPLSRVAVSQQARDLLDGIITVHRELPVNRTEPGSDEVVPHPTVPAAGYTPEQHRLALDRRRADTAELAGVATELDTVDRRAVELNRRMPICSSWPSPVTARQRGSSRSGDGGAVMFRATQRLHVRRDLVRVLRRDKAASPRRARGLVQCQTP